MEDRVGRWVPLTRYRVVAYVLPSQSCSKGLRVLVWTSQTVLSSGINPMLTSQINDRILGLRSSFAAQRTTLPSLGTARWTISTGGWLSCEGT